MGGERRGEERRGGEGRGGEGRGGEGRGGEGRGGEGRGGEGERGPSEARVPPPMYAMMMYSRSVKFSGITSPIGPPTLRNITSSNVER